MSLIIVTVFILLISVKLLNLNNKPEKSVFYCSNAQFKEQIIKHAPNLSKPYTPTMLWGYSGHLQTIFREFLSFFRNVELNGERFSLRTSDGATVTYDFYQPLYKKANKKDLILALSPGVGGSSESSHIRCLVHHAQVNGYCVAVLNHIGFLKCVPVTSPRIFNFGNTNKLACMGPIFFDKDIPVVFSSLYFGTILDT